MKYFSRMKIQNKKKNFSKINKLGVRVERGKFSSMKILFEVIMKIGSLHILKD